MEDILTPINDKMGKWAFVLCVVPAFLAIFFFVALENIRGRGGAATVPLWGGIICTVLAVLFGTIAFIRFLRSRSIVTGLFITTTTATLVYSIASRAVRFRTAAVSPTAPVTLANTSAAAGNTFFSSITLAQVGLFAVWFLFILFTIYVYIRPIRRIDSLLTQILDGQEIRKPRVGKSVQYKKIENKLKILADEKHRRDVARANRLSKARQRTARQRALMQELLTEKEKLSPAVTPAPPAE
jgi:uncharacterized membrane protein YhdT